MTANTTERLDERLEAAKDNAVLQAQIWKMEAQAANATIAEIYRLVGSQAGNWNGAQPVRDFLAQYESERAAVEGLGEIIGDEALQLAMFYSAKTWQELVHTMSDHIERLQAKLPARRDEQPRNPRGA
jgi:inactivated superfamily I helicase